MRVYPELTVDGEFQALGDLGHTGALNDRQFTFLRSRGFTNSLTDMFGQYRSWTPTQLFTTAGSRGFFYDFSDYSTQFTDTAGTTAITGTGASLARIDDKSGLGNNATQATAGSRPLTTTIGTGYRGVQFDGVDDFLQTAAIDFAGAESLGPELVTNGTFASNITGWSDTSSAGGSIAWNAAGYLDLINATGTARTQQDFAVTAGRTYKFVVSNPGANTVDVYAGSTSGGIELLSATVLAGQTGTYILTATSSLLSLGFRNFGAGTTDSIDNVSVKEVLFAADKMTVVAGVRKLSDAARGMVVELGAGGVNGSFNLEAPFSGPLTHIGSNARGTISVGAAYLAEAPTTQVVSVLQDISGDDLTIRGNGAQKTQSTADQGTGNFANNIVYIGRRGGASLPFNGILTFLCVINRVLTAAELAQLEAFANGKTGAY